MSQETRTFMVEATFAVNPEKLEGKVFRTSGSSYAFADDGGVMIVVTVDALGPIHASLMAAPDLYDLLGVIEGPGCVSLTPYKTTIIDSELSAEFWAGTHLESAA